MSVEELQKLLHKVRSQGHALHERSLVAETHVANGGGLDAYAAERMVAHARDALAAATALHNHAIGQPAPKIG